MIQEKVVSTMALVLEQFIIKVALELPKASFVYDEKLTYDTSITKFRSDNNITDETFSDALPLFSFRRSILRHADRGMGRRSPRLQMKQYTGNLANTYKVVHGEMDIDFVFYCKTAQDAELFEIEYASDLGITNQKELRVDTRADLNTDLPYYVEYNPLSDKSIESDSSYFKAITGQAIVRGYFPVFQTQSKRIEEIQVGIYTYTDKLIKSATNKVGEIKIEG